MGTSTTPVVLPNYLSRMTLMGLASWRKRLLLGCHLHVLHIGALNVERWKTVRTWHCGWQSADVVQCHITKSVCQGAKCFLTWLLIFYTFFVIVLFSLRLMVYHSEISFEKKRGGSIRAWQLDDRIIIYCGYVISYLFVLRSFSSLAYWNN